MQRSQATDEATRAVRTYDEVAATAAHAVLAAYSSSFGLGTRTLPRRVRRDIEAVYALVRIADEVVDTPRGQDAAAALDELEQQVGAALVSGYSSNIVVHAFVTTARRTGIGHEEVDPFFASMRADLTVTTHTRASYERYVYGSAEVVGVMCLKVFCADDHGPAHLDPAAVAGARALGAAFQKINFLRDLGADSAGLGRAYFPDVSPGAPTDAQVAEILTEIRGDLATASAALPVLPLAARRAVAVTIALYTALLDRLAVVPAAQLAARRVRVSGPRKVALAAAVLLRSLAWGRHRVSAVVPADQPRVAGQGRTADQARTADQPGGAS